VCKIWSALIISGPFLQGFPTMFDLLASNPMIQAMDQSMTLSTRRMALIAANMANIDTPGYHTQDFDFQSALKTELGNLDGNQLPMTQTNSRHFPISSGGTQTPPTDEVHPAYERNDGNDVSLDRESKLLAQTQINYQLSSNFAQLELRKVFQMIRDAKA
jgi:flagellar basal-body rod protein FlgB